MKIKKAESSNSTENLVYSAVKFVKRCRVLFFEPKSEFELNLKTLVTSERGLKRKLKWLAYAGHLSTPIEVSFPEMQLLGEVDEVRPYKRDILNNCYSSELVDRLLEKRLLVSCPIENSVDSGKQVEEDSIPWHPLAQLYHMHGRWSDIHLADSEIIKASMKIQPILQEHKTPPSYKHVPTKIIKTVDLPIPKETWVDELLSRRSTCRNFDPIKFLSLDQLSSILNRVWRVKTRRTLSNELEVVTKNSPAGGSIHAGEAYFIIHRVEGLNPGLYHYNSLDHNLELMQSLTIEQIDILVRQATADQKYFNPAAVLVIMTARFDRLYWKYRYHSKAFKVSSLDAGHLCQNLYIAATEMNLGVIVSAAVNDVELENALEIDPIREGIIAVCGIGPKNVLN